MKKKLMSLLFASIFMFSLLFVSTLPVNAITVTGPGGTARLDYMYSAPGYFTWSVQPNTLWPYIFTGSISWSGGSSGYMTIGGAGAIGSTSGGTFAAGTYGTGMGWAYMEGTAYNNWGDKFVVAPTVEISYYTGAPGGGGGGGAF